MGRSRSLEVLAEALRSAFSHVGPRQSLRMALKLLSLDDKAFEFFVQAMRQARTRVGRCGVCRDLTESELCVICRDQTRDKNFVCIVENPQDVEAVEAGRGYRGLYHVLHGSLDPKMEFHSTNGNDPMALDDLWERLKTSPGIEEVILATDQDTAGELTSLYLAKEIKTRFPRLKLTRIGVGIPFGGEVLYADPATVKQAILSRTQIAGENGG
ncbi:MAG: recombination protein RecR [Elusimicrobia bacterium]|nr:recombination protein RecR [Elusimicrobiota bacterium]